jgi:DNA (cytosine-5)-methyltransferase 1
MKVLSLFAGAGGLDIGFEATGAFETVLAIDFAGYCTATLEGNKSRRHEIRLEQIAPWLRPPPGFAGQSVLLNTASVIRRDLSTASADDIRQLYSGVIDGVIGGPPCQPFSTRSRNRNLPRGLADVEGRGNLIFTFLNLVRTLEPRFFLFENVLGLDRDDLGNVLDSLLAYAKEHLPYSLHVSKVVASDYGVPQSRKRVFVVGFRQPAPYSPPPVSHGTETLFARDLRPFVTVREALASLSPPSRGGSVSNHELRKHSPETVRRFATIPPGKEDPIRKKPRLHPERPAPAVFSGSVDGGGLSDIHPWEDRALTPRETARLQGFPDCWEFVSNRVGEVYKLVANAVPPALAAAFARQIAIALVDDTGVEGYPAPSAGSTRSGCGASRRAGP